MITTHIDRSRRTWTILTCIFLMGGAACNGGKTPEPASPTTPAATSSQTPPASSGNTEEDALRSRALAAIEKYQLTAITRGCLTVEIDGITPDSDELTVYELHDERCGGDPATQPRLFSLQMARSSARILSDVTSTDGEFRVLQE